jgi:hypothetical protein
MLARQVVGTVAMALCSADTIDGAWRTSTVTGRVRAGTPAVAVPGSRDAARLIPPSVEALGRHTCQPQLVLLLQPVVWLLVLVSLLLVAERRRRSGAAITAWLVTLACAVGYYWSLNVEMNRADATGDGGNPWAGSVWFVGVCAAALLSVLLARKGNPGSGPDDAVRAGPGS